MKEDQALHNTDNIKSLSELHRGDLLNSISLIAGTTIGAGVLALPAATLPAGLLPSTLLMVGVWLYMAVSGLLIAEANLYVMQQQARPEVGLLATIRHQLGKEGAIASGLLYAFIHYALLVAYAARGGDILAAAVQNLELQLGLTPAIPLIPLWLGHVAFVALLGSLLLFGKEQFVGRLNSGLLGIVMVAFFGLLAFSWPQTESSRWVPQHWQAIGGAVPVMFVAFVYHNVVPVVTTRLQGDRTQIRQAIFLGSLVPLVMFLLWNAVILGSVEPQAAGAAALDPIELLRSGVEGAGLGIAVSVFSEFAIATSFIGFVYGLVNFFADLWHASKAGDSTAQQGDNVEQSLEIDHSKQERITIQRISTYALILIPPTILSTLSPHIFFDAIDISGAFGISILFGIIPAVMIWKQRYQSDIETVPMIGGGKGLLSVMIGIASFVLIQHVLIQAGLF